jgi:hypothetical protein
MMSQPTPIPSLEDYPGLIAAWSAAGKSNDDADRNVLRDLTGNGHDITLSNFAFSGMSGYGGFYGNGNGKYSFTSIRGGLVVFSKTPVLSKTFKYKVTGLREALESANFLALQVTTYDEEGVARSGSQTQYDGEWTIDLSNAAYVRMEFYGQGSNTSCNVNIELSPIYPDGLVYDGTDDYNSAVDFGDIEIGTVIMKCQKTDTEGFYCYFGNVGDFVSRAFRLYNSSSDEEVDIKIASFDKNIYIYNSNTQKAIYSSGWRSAPFSINGRPTNGFSESGRFVFYSAYLFDRSLNEQEIKAFIRKYIDADYLLPSEQKNKG